MAKNQEKELHEKNKLGFILEYYLSIMLLTTNVVNNIINICNTPKIGSLRLPI